MNSLQYPSARRRVLQWLEAHMDQSPHPRDGAATVTTANGLKVYAAPKRDRVEADQIDAKGQQLRAARGAGL